MNQLTTAAPTAAGQQQSEISSELTALDRSIQSTFDASRTLMDRLQPILKQYPSSPQAEKTPEEAMSDIGANIRNQRKSVEGIDAMLREIISRIAI
jgi:predicted  nucleic acid-binding Zn-ribbon protein